MGSERKFLLMGGPDAEQLASDKATLERHSNDESRSVHVRFVVAFLNEAAPVAAVRVAGEPAVGAEQVEASPAMPGVVDFNDPINTPRQHVRSNREVDLHREVVVGDPSGKTVTPRLILRLTGVKGDPRADHADVRLEVVVAETFTAAELMYHGNNIGRVGTKLELDYSPVSRTAEVRYAELAG